MHFIMYYHSSFIEEKVFNNIEAIHDKTEAKYLIEYGTLSVINMSYTCYHFN